MEAPQWLSGTKACRGLEASIDSNPLHLRSATSDDTSLAGKKIASQRQQDAIQMLCDQAVLEAGQN